MPHPQEFLRKTKQPTTQQVGTARSLRRKQTDAELKLWSHLSGRQLEGAKFRRQHPIGDYVADFACIEQRLVIEVDGGHHNEDEIAAADRERTAWLKANGWRVLRFWNNEVGENLEGAIEVIRAALGDEQPPAPSP